MVEESFLDSYIVITESTPCLVRQEVIFGGQERIVTVK